MYSRVKSRLLLILLITALINVHLLSLACETVFRGTSPSALVLTDTFRSQQLDEAALQELKECGPGERAALCGAYQLRLILKEKQIFTGLAKPDSDLLTQRFLTSKRTESEEYLNYLRAIWEDVTYFPVPVSTVHSEYTVNFCDSWMSERTYGGTRGHEGCDLMAGKDVPGLYPVVSMTDGKVTAMGWLEQGGYRMGIQAPSGGYFYYAHLDSYADLEEGDTVSAGDVIGFMGNTGYGPEGTRGMFATHLHVGIYLYPEGRETSVNPYWVLRMIEEKKLSCSF